MWLVMWIILVMGSRVLLLVKFLLVLVCRLVRVVVIMIEMGRLLCWFSFLEVISVCSLVSSLLWLCWVWLWVLWLMVVVLGVVLMIGVWLLGLVVLGVVSLVSMVLKVVCVWGVR